MLFFRKLFKKTHRKGAERNWARRVEITRKITAISNTATDIAVKPWNLERYKQVLALRSCNKSLDELSEGELDEKVAEISHLIREFCQSAAEAGDTDMVFDSIRLAENFNI